MNELYKTKSKVVFGMTTTVVWHWKDGSDSCQAKKLLEFVAFIKS